MEENGECIMEAIENSPRESITCVVQLADIYVRSSHKIIRKVFK
jgi:hypothetical protein